MVAYWMVVAGSVLASTQIYIIITAISFSSQQRNVLASNPGPVAGRAGRRLQQVKEDPPQKTPDKTHSGMPVKRPVVWIQGHEQKTALAEEVFRRFGYLPTSKPSAPWEVVWTDGDPFTGPQSPVSRRTVLQPWQRVNHYPGLPRLLTSGRVPLVDGVKDPLLVDNRLFDLTAFVVVTCINPLRVYIYDGDYHFRFCSQPFSADRDPVEQSQQCFQPGSLLRDIDQIPALDKLYNKLGFTGIESLLSHLRTDLHMTSVERLRASMHAAVRSVLLQLEPHMISAARDISFERHFFELMQMTFAVGNDLSVKLKQVALNPDLQSSKSHPYRPLHQHVVFSTLSMLGLRRHFTQYDGNFSHPSEGSMHVSIRDLSVYLDECLDMSCRNNCRTLICSLCRPCVNEADTLMLKNTFREHVQRFSFRRVFPKPFESDDAASTWSPDEDDDFRSLSTSNQWLTLWYRDKCVLDSAWCY